MDQSLNRFFKTVAPATLNDCDREEIHLSGLVQGVCDLLVLEPSDGKIIGASETVGRFFDAETRALLDRPIGSVHPELSGLIADIGRIEPNTHEVVDIELNVDGLAYDAVAHVHHGLCLVEYVPNSDPSSNSLRRNMRKSARACSEIMAASDFDTACQIAAHHIRDITGFDRVKVYQFQADWSGAVVAESRVDEMPSFLGLHFPAGDIPQQVRALMMMMPNRSLYAVDDVTQRIITTQDKAETIDLTCSLTRAASVMHTAYLRNMGVGSTFTSALRRDCQLWGMIACHSNARICLPFDVWGLVQEIGNALLLRLQQHEKTQGSAMLQRLRIVENRFAKEVRQRGELGEVIEMMAPIFMEFLAADGFAFQYGNSIITSGKTPPDAFIRDLVTYARGLSGDDDQYRSISLAKEYPAAAEHMETACGVLLQPIVVHRICQLIWFRGPVTRTVHWAGRSDGKDDEGQPEYGLSPRNSFDSWVQQHSDQCLPWDVAEQEAARDIFKEFLDIIAAQLLMREENASLRAFASMAAHDIRAPLLGISKALEWMEEEDFDPEVVRETHGLANLSAQRLAALTANLVELSMLNANKIELNATDLHAAATEASELLSIPLEQAGGTIRIEPLPTVPGSAGLLVRLFLNLITNAIKYRHRSRALNLAISGEMDGENIVLSVVDNGIGIPMEKRESVFSPMVRLHAQQDIEGSGLGLTICRRIVEMHKGEILADPEFEDGTRIVITLPRGA